MADNNLNALIAGGEFGRGVRNDSMRMQQLRSQQALQRLQEQQAAETLRWTLMQHAQAIQQQADNTKAASAFMATQAPFINIPSMRGGTVPAPNPAYTPDIGQAYIKSFLPVSRDPSKTLMDAATLQLKQAQALDERNLAQTRGQVRPQSPLGKLQADRAAAEQRGDTKAAQEIDKLITEQRSGGAADPIIERKLRLYEEALRDGNKIRIQAYENDLGLNKLSPNKKALYDAELTVLDRDMKLMFNQEEYLKKRLEIVRRYFNDENGTATSDTPTSAPGSRSNPIKFDWKNGKLIRIP